MFPRNSRERGYSKTFLTARWYRWSTGFYFLCAWNALGLVIYQLAKKGRKYEDEPEKKKLWDNMTGTQKFLFMSHYGSEDTKIRHVRLRGLTGGISSHDSTIGQLLAPVESEMETKCEPVPDTETLTD